MSQNQNFNYKIYYHLFPNGKLYFGITMNSLQDRWKNGHGYNTDLMKRAIRKYGWENIGHVLFADHLTESEAKNMESILITSFQTNNFAYGYNLTFGGDGSHLNDYSNIEKMFNDGLSRAEIANVTNYGWTSIDRYLKNLGYTSKELNKNDHRENKGKKISQFSLLGDYIKTFDSINQAELYLGCSYGTISHSMSKPIHRAHNSLWQFGESVVYNGVIPKDNRERAIKRVAQFDMDGNLINIFANATAAARFFGKKDHSFISSCCRGERLSAYGFKWKYIEKIIEDDIMQEA